MSTVTFKTKGYEIWISETEKETRYKIPKFTRSHCDMSGFRDHKSLGNYANSDMFLGFINSLVNRIYPKGYIKVESLSPETTVKSGFLQEFTIDLKNYDIRGNKVLT